MVVESIHLLLSTRKLRISFRRIFMYSSVLCIYVPGLPSLTPISGIGFPSCAAFTDDVSGAVIPDDSSAVIVVVFSVAS